MLASIIALSRMTGVQMADSSAVGEVLLRDGVPVGDTYVQDTVIGQVAKTVFSDFPIGLYFVTAVTGIILVLAANTAFNGFPVLGSILAKDGFLPRQLHTRGDRLAFSNGILILAAAAIFLVIAYNADVTQLIQLYIVGVFVSFTLSQTGMIRHWNRLLKEETDPKARSKMFRARIINAVGAAMSITVLLVVLVTKFQAGAKYAILAMAVLYVMMLAINRHYRPREPGAGPARWRPARGDPAQPGACARPGLQVAQAGHAGHRLCPRDPSLGARGAHRRSRPGGDCGVAGREWDRS
jgi:amino acid transporter